MTSSAPDRPAGRIAARVSPDDPVARCLIQGLVLAFGRPRYVLLDVGAKLFRWFVLFLLAMLAFSATLAQIPASELDVALLDSGIEELEALVLLEGLATHVNLLAANFIAAGVIGILASGVIEAVARGVIVEWATLDDSGSTTARKRPRDVGPRLFRSVVRHLASGVTTRLILATAVIGIGLVSFGPVLTEWGGEWTTTGPGTDGRWPALAGLVLIALVGFFATVVDTVTRLGALDLVGTRLPELILVSTFPILISATVWALSLTALVGLASGQMLDPALVFAIVLATATLTSAMFLVRCGAVHRMQRDFLRPE